MKKLILIAIALIGLQVVAQGPRGNREDFKNLTAEEIATKRTEKMTADLGLDAKQEKAVHAMNLEDSKKLKARMEARASQKNSERPSEEEREKMRAERKKHQEAANAKLKELEASKEKGGRGKRGGKKKEGA